MEINEKTSWIWTQKVRKLIQNAPKMTLWSSLEPPGALLWCRVYFKTSFGSHFGSFWGSLGDPVGSLWGAFSVPFSLFGRSWDLKMVVFWKGPFWHHFFRRFFIKFGSIFGAFGTLTTLTIRVRGYKNHTFGYVVWLIVLDTILGSIWAPFWSLKWTPNPIVTHFGDPMWPYRLSFRGYLGVPFFDVFLGGVLNDILSQKAPPKGRGSFL